MWPVEAFLASLTGSSPHTQPWVPEENTPAPLGEFGVRSPPRCGRKVTPRAPTGETASADSRPL